MLGGVVALGLAASAASAATFSNTDAITINDGSSTCAAPGLATPSYPSTITVTNSDFPEGSRIGDVNVTVSGLSHTFPDDVGLLLVSPAGKSTILMTDSGGGSIGHAVSGINLTFDDAASGSLPDSTLLESGTYLPTKGSQGPGTPSEGCPVPSPFPAPAPAGPYGSTLSVFNGSDPKGTWQLYVIDDAEFGAGSISGGWSLEISLDTTAPTIQSTSPQDGATKVSRTNPNITATFSEQMGSFPANSFRLEKVRVQGQRETVLETVSTTVQNPADPSTPNVVRLALGQNVPLDKGSYYRVTITTAATDVAGNPLQAGTTWRFKTAPK